MRAKIPGAIGSALVMIFVLSWAFGCSKSGGSTMAPPPTPVHSSHFHTVMVQSSTYMPAALTIAPGDTVIWTNSDSMDHTVTSDTGSELNSPLNIGQSFQHVFAAAGSFAYHCTIHPFMHGTVSVE
jgi:plastocyanin